jgi:hypothetical protein
MACHMHVAPGWIVVGPLIASTIGCELTLTAADPDKPDVVAVMLAVPTEFPVTYPSPVTGATPVLELDHENVEFGIAFPLASNTVASNCLTDPVATVSLDGVTSTVAGAP